MVAVLVGCFEKFEGFLGFGALVSVYAGVGVREVLGHSRFPRFGYVLSWMQEITVLIESTKHNQFFIVEKGENRKRRVVAPRLFLLE
jgi:hypothetical protein